MIIFNAVFFITHKSLHWKIWSSCFLQLNVYRRIRRKISASLYIKYLIFKIAEKDMKRWLISAVQYCDDQIYLQKISSLDHNRQFPRKLAVWYFTITPTVSILWESYDRCSVSPKPCLMGRLAYKSSSKSRHRKGKYVCERSKLDLTRSERLLESLPNALCCRRRHFFNLCFTLLSTIISWPLSARKFSQLSYM